LKDTAVNVLLVEDNPADARLVKEMLIESGRDRFTLHHVNSVSQASRYLDQNRCDVLLLDLSLPDSQGLAGLSTFSQLAPELPVVVLTGLYDEDLALEAVHQGAQDYLVKGQGDGALLTRSLFYAIERKRSEQRLTYLAQYDPLTNLPNRVLFRDRLTQSIKHTKRKDLAAALMFLDLDHFKDINDTMGHDAGDVLLQEVAGRLKSCIRDQDTVARLGGDEFTIILEELSEPRYASTVAQKILDTMARPFNINGNNVFVTTSIGIVTYPANGDEPETVIKKADMALYSAKDKGRSNFQYFEEHMNTAVAERMALITSLRQAVDRDELVIHYQPQYILQTGQLVGMEALLRWRHPERGLVSPLEFVPLLEETGLIDKVGDWVLRQACWQHRRWQENGSAPLRVAVNLSPRQFRQQNLVKTIRSILAETGLEPRYLQLELTESTLMDGSDRTLDTLYAIHNLGVQLSIDDFGTGFSSLSYLKRFPFDALKVDKSFVQDIGTDPNGKSIVAAVIELAHSLNLSVVAEGVEMPGQVAFLTDEGCDEVQGFLYSQPLPVSACDALVRTGWYQRGDAARVSSQASVSTHSLS
jgi:diguanylate cyclase (GGDEF)-like protein